MVQSIFDALLILLVCSAKFDLMIENLIEYLKNISERGKSRKPTWPYIALRQAYFRAKKNQKFCWIKINKKLCCKNSSASNAVSRFYQT